MFKLELFREKKLLREYFFDKTLAVTMGRRPTHNIHINHMGVSADHAKIHFFPDCLLEDLGSKNGTTLNERRIDKTAKLIHGDIIGIVNYRLRFTDREKISEPDNAWEGARVNLFSARKKPIHRRGRGGCRGKPSCSSSVSSRVLCGKKGFVFVGCCHDSNSVVLSLPGIHERFPSLIFIMNF